MHRIAVLQYHFCHRYYCYHHCERVCVCVCGCLMQHRTCRYADQEARWQDAACNPSGTGGVLSSSGNLDIRLSGLAERSHSIQALQCKQPNNDFLTPIISWMQSCSETPDRPSFDLHTDVCIKKRLACVMEYPVSCQNNFVGSQEGRRLREEILQIVGY